MTKMIDKIKMYFLLFCLAIVKSLYAADGDTFIVETAGGIKMSFMVVSESGKTCAVGTGTGILAKCAIDPNATGIITVPQEVNGYQVEGICAHAFSSCKNISNIIIPNTVKDIGDWAFSECASLKAVSLSNSILTIGPYAFYGCSNLTSITIPNSVFAIGNGTFQNCISLNSVTSEIDNPFDIPDYAFKNISNDAVLYVPEESKEKYINLAGWVKNFSQVVELQDFYKTGDVFTTKTVEGVNMTFTVTNAKEKTCAVGGDSGIKCVDENTSGNVTIPHKVRGYLVNEIKNSAFERCRHITQVSIPFSVINIGVFAFADCHDLSVIEVDENNSVFDSRDKCNAVINKANNELIVGCKGTEIPSSVTRIGAYSFYGCENMNNIIIPNSVTSIGDHAFAYCVSLVNLTIPNSVTSIGMYAFRTCRYLSIINSKIENPFNIAENVFYNIPNNATLYVPVGTKNKYETCSGWTKCFKNVVEGYSYSTGDNIKGYTDEGVEMTFNVISIDDMTCQVGDGYNSAIDKTWAGPVTIPYEIEGFTVVDIASHAFYGCRDLTEIDIPDNVTTIGEYAFRNCSSLTTITIPGKVTSIGKSAFESCSSLEKILLPYYLTSIGRSAFRKCTNLIGITIPDKVMSIEDYTFEGCSSLLNVAIPSSCEVASIGRYAFDGCSSLTTIYLPNGLTAIGDYAFCGCSGLTSITVPGSVMTIGSNPFERCSGLASIKVDEENPKYDSRNNCNAIIETVSNSLIVGCKNTTIPNSVIEIGTSAFSGCRNLTSISIPNSVLVIQNWAFSSADLTSINIPNSVVGIGYEAFRDCYDLTSIVIGSGLKNISDYVFFGCSSLAAIQWNAEIALPAKAFTQNFEEFEEYVKYVNPNLLLYVKSRHYAPSTVKNVIENGVADNITLVDTSNYTNNNFYCPLAFTAKHITYQHNYSMRSGFNTCEGWETIALPFDVTAVTNWNGSEIVPYITWDVNKNQFPFWLYSLEEQGWQEASTIKANTPYIISMPNNDEYEDIYNLKGDITFVGTDVQVVPSEALKIGKFGQRKLVPNFQYRPVSSNILALNVNNQLSEDKDMSRLPGSTFVRDLRPVYPFEAYLTVGAAEAARLEIPVFDAVPTSIKGIRTTKSKSDDVWFSIDGQKLQGKPTAKGIYIVNGRKVVIK